MTRTPLVALAVLLLTVVLLIGCQPPAGADDSPTISVGVIKTLAPDLTLEFGVNASYQVWTPPADWVVVGGRPLWLDFLYLDKHGFAGVSMECFDTTRIGLTAYRIGADSGTDWSVYLVTPLVSW